MKHTNHLLNDELPRIAIYPRRIGIFHHPPHMTLGASPPAAEDEFRPPFSPSGNSASLANRTHPDLHDCINGSIVYVNSTILVRFGEIENHILEPKFVDQPPAILLHIVSEKIGQGIYLNPTREDQPPRFYCRGLIDKGLIHFQFQFVGDENILEMIIPCLLTNRGRLLRGLPFPAKT